MRDGSTPEEDRRRNEKKRRIEANSPLRKTISAELQKIASDHCSCDLMAGITCSIHIDVLTAYTTINEAIEKNE